jgi:hypothetical protein
MGLQGVKNYTYSKTTLQTSSFFLGGGGGLCYDVFRLTLRHAYDVRRCQGGVRRQRADRGFRSALRHSDHRLQIGAVSYVAKKCFRNATE